MLRSYRVRRMVRNCSAIRCYLEILSISLLFFICFKSASASMGTVEVLDSGLPSEAESISVVPSNPTPGASETTLSALTSPFELSEPINRPWMINAPLGATAFVLDHQQLQLGLEETHQARLLDVNATLFEIHYGVTDSFTLSAGVGLTNSKIFLLNPKWNFYNEGSVSYSLGLYVGMHPIPYFQDWTQSQQRSSIPYALELASSRVFDDWHKLHLSLFAGSETEVDSVFVGRFSAAYELRVSQRSGFTFSLSPEVQLRNWTWTESYAPLFNGSRDELNPMINTYSWSDHNISLGLGVGYHVFWNHFGISVGLEAGPNYNASYDYFEPFKFLAGSTVIDYRI